MRETICAVSHCRKCGPGGTTTSRENISKPGFLILVILVLAGIMTITITVAVAEENGTGGDPLTPPGIPSTTPTPTPELEQESPTTASESFSESYLTSFQPPELDYSSLYDTTPAPAPENSTNNITAVTPSPPAGLLTVPTPLATDSSRTGPGTSFATLVSLLAGLVCAGYLACIGFLMIKR
jgi:hypothetical protein